MRSFFWSTLALGACILCGLVGYIAGIYSGPTYRVPPLRFLEGQTDVQLFASSFDANSLVGTVDVKELVPAMRDAPWTSQNPLRIGSWKLRFPDGHRVNLSFYGNFFWLEDVPGYFQMPEESRLTSEIAIARLMAASFVDLTSKRRRQEVPARHGAKAN
jgi:hypothetical protein